MTNVLVVVGSARKGRVAEKVAGYVKEEIEKHEGMNAIIADLAEANLPFFDNEHSPSSPDYSETNEYVQAWAKQVSDADAVVLVAPEYNHSLSGIQKNAIDWLFVEWENKPVSVVAYGWGGGVNSVNAVKEMAPVIKIDLKPTATTLGFMQELSPDGSLLDEAATRSKIDATLAELA